MICTALLIGTKLKKDNLCLKGKIMFRIMRRSKQQMQQGECIDILKNASNGVLAVAGDDDYPYAVPLSFVYTDNVIYFHCAVTGHKLDAIKKQDKVSFCVVGIDDIAPEKFTTMYKSVIVFGRAQIVEDANEKMEAIKLIGLKYSSDYINKLDDEIKNAFDRICIVKINIENITGKAAIELIK